MLFIYMKSINTKLLFCITVFLCFLLYWLLIDIIQNYIYNPDSYNLY